MSSIRAITTNIETVIAALVPETPLSAARFRYVDGAPSQLQLRQFAVAPTGGAKWFDEFPQDVAGTLVAEGFEIVIGYPAAHPDRNIRDVIREDVLAIQYALLDPANWDDATTRSDRRDVDGYSVQFDAESERLSGIEVSIPLTVRYRPF